MYDFYTVRLWRWGVEGGGGTPTVIVNPGNGSVTEARLAWKDEPSLVGVFTRAEFEELGKSIRDALDGKF